MADVHNGWLVGDGGLVVRTADGGATWQPPPGPLPDGVARQFDFRAIALHEGHCWIAGSPGGRVLHSADALERLAQQHPNHPLTEWAAMWLVRYYSSGEAAWRAREKTRGDSRRLQAAPPEPRAGPAKASWRQEILAPRFEQPAAAVRRAVAEADAMTPGERAGRAAALGKWIQRTQPALFAGPAIGFLPAAADQPDECTVEAAIPLTELVPRPPGARDAWGIGLQRTVPGAGFQSWTTPAATDVRPEGFGLLTFE